MSPTIKYFLLVKKLTRATRYFLKSRVVKNEIDRVETA